MIKKLMKYDLKDNALFNIIMYILLLITTFTTLFSSYNTESLTLFFSTIFFYMASFANIIGTIILLLYTFRKKLLTDNAYLTLSLPVTKTQIIISYTITSLIWLFITFIFNILLWIVITNVVTKKAFLLESLFNYDLPTIIILFITILLYTLLTTEYCFLSLLLGHKFKHKIIFTVIFYNIFKAITKLFVQAPYTMTQISDLSISVINLLPIIIISIILIAIYAVCNIFALKYRFDVE